MSAAVTVLRLPVVLFLLAMSGWGCLSDDPEFFSGGFTPDIGVSVRTLRGRVDAVGPDCVADAVVAAAGPGINIQSPVRSDCTFRIELGQGNAYVINFTRDGIFVATLIFAGVADGFSTFVLPIGEGSGAIDVGDVRLAGFTALPGRDPLEQTDFDDDGVADRFDEDDDGDDVRDLAEIDCDLDGIPDDFDNRNDGPCPAGNLSVARVIEAKPRHDPDPENPFRQADLDTDPRLRVACLVEPSGVTADTFRITPITDTFACDFDFDASNVLDQQTIRCRHHDFFLPATTYTVTLGGIRCRDGRFVENRSWVFRTGTLLDENGEDEFDDAGF